MIVLLKLTETENLDHNIFNRISEILLNKNYKKIPYKSIPHYEYEIIYNLLEKTADPKKREKYLNIITRDSIIKPQTIRDLSDLNENNDK